MSKKTNTGEWGEFKNPCRDFYLDNVIGVDLRHPAPIKLHIEREKPKTRGPNGYLAHCAEVRQLNYDQGWRTEDEPPTQVEIEYMKFSKLPLATVREMSRDTIKWGIDAYWACKDPLEELEIPY